MGSALYVVHKWLRLINLELTMIKVMPYNKLNDNPPHPYGQTSSDVGLFLLWRELWGHLNL